jgi:hypothetical protein
MFLAANDLQTPNRQIKDNEPQNPDYLIPKDKKNSKRIPSPKDFTVHNSNEIHAEFLFPTPPFMLSGICKELQFSPNKENIHNNCSILGKRDQIKYRDSHIEPIVQKRHKLFQM